jgi:hypothetical protein
VVTGITLGELYTYNLMLAASGKPTQTRGFRCTAHRA